MSKLPIDDIVNVVVSTTGAPAVRDTFNTGLILGASDHITVADRCKAYSSLSDMAEDGFVSTDPEYKAAELYFAQSSRPRKVIIGRRNAAENNGETWVEAVTACAEKSGEWYGLYIASATALTSAEITAVATAVEAMRAAFFFEDATAADITSATTDVFSVLKAAGRRRTVGLYSTTGYAGAALMGYAMGANDGSPDSAFTLFGKKLDSVETDDLTASAVTILKGKNANYYVSRGAYTLLENGVTASGEWFDEVLGLDQLANDLQLACMDVLVNAESKIPYNDSGVALFINACNAACAVAANRGFLTAGDWDQDDIIDLQNGDTLEAGYYVQAQSADAMSATDRANRVCPTLYVAIHLSGAIHSVLIRVNVVE